MSILCFESWRTQNVSLLEYEPVGLHDTSLANKLLRLRAILNKLLQYLSVLTRNCIYNQSSSVLYKLWGLSENDRHKILAMLSVIAFNLPQFAGKVSLELIIGYLADTCIWVRVVAQGRVVWEAYARVSKIWLGFRDALLDHFACFVKDFHRTAMAKLERSRYSWICALRWQIRNFVLVFALLAHTAAIARIVCFTGQGAGFFEVGVEHWYLFLHLWNLESNLVSCKLTRLFKCWKRIFFYVGSGFRNRLLARLFVYPRIAGRSSLLWLWN